MTTLTTDPTITFCQFIIIADTREQAPYSFDNLPPLADGRRPVVAVERAGLETGDYSIAGLADKIAVERKSLEDLYSTLGSGRRRFEREVERLAALQFAAIVVEADIREIWRPAEFRPGWRSKLSPRSVEGTITAWSIRHPTVHWWAMGSRRAAEIRVFLTLEMFWRQMQHDQR